jgi:hypothetical protein
VRKTLWECSPLVRTRSLRRERMKKPLSIVLLIDTICAKCCWRLRKPDLLIGLTSVDRYDRHESKQPFARGESSIRFGNHRMARMGVAGDELTDPKKRREQPTTPLPVRRVSGRVGWAQAAVVRHGRALSAMALPGMNDGASAPRIKGTPGITG